jgi:hypothetical protein
MRESISHPKIRPLVLRPLKNPAALPLPGSEKGADAAMTAS